MALQHPENLFRRYRGQLVTVKTMSGGIYEGTVTEVTNDFVELLREADGKAEQVFVLFHSIESMTAPEAAAH
jgi:small nuclear ribonucleoprotein (snRNP)-like protein